MKKNERHRALIEIIRARPVASQNQLRKELERLGMNATQSSISRDLDKLGVIKLRGTYRLPHLDPGESALVDLLDVETAGENLIVLKTLAGQAQIVALTIDRAQIQEVAGTVAGDDTIFVAIRNTGDQSRATRQILQLFRTPAGRKRR